MSIRALDRIIAIKPEPQTTPSLVQAITRAKARETVGDYHFTPSLRAHFQRVFDCIVHRKGQGFWVQAEYGAGKTHFLGALIDLLIWRDADVWGAVRDTEVKSDYAAALAKVKMFPVAFSLRGMGESGESDSLMRVFEEQIRESIRTFAPELDEQVKVTSAELAAHWYAEEASDDEKAGVINFFRREHACTPEEYRMQSGLRKFGQELVHSKLPEGRLRGKFKERFAFIYEQITKVGGYDGMLFVVDEFRSWQDRHVAGTAAYAEDEEILETLAFVLPSQHCNITTLIASQGDMPQKLSGGGEGDRFIPLYLLADKNKGDFGEIVGFRCRELLQGAATDIKEYYDYCRKEYRFIRQANISLDSFTAIFPFQPRCFDVMRRMTQNAERHNLPTARSAIRMAWQTLSQPELLQGKRLLTLADIMHSDELQKGLNFEHYRDGYLNVCGAIEQLSELDLAPEEREQAQRLVETLYLWGVSLPENLRDGLTAQEAAEAAWLSDDAVGATAQAEHLLDRLVQGGFPIRVEKKTRDGKEVAIYAYEVSAAQESPVKYFAPLKKMAKQDLKGQESKWLESLFWQLPDMTPEAQQELGIDGGILGGFQPPDQRAARDRQEGKPPAYAFPHRTGASTRRVHKVSYSGEAVVCERWREEFGKEIDNPDQHFRLVYLTSHPNLDDAKIAGDLKDARIAVMWPEALCEDTREALADLMAAEQMKRNCSAPNQSSLRDYADVKRREALKAVLKCQQDEYRRGKVITQKGYGIPAVEIFKSTQRREDDLAGRLLDKAYDTPLFSPKDLRKDLTDADTKKVFAGLFHKDPARAEKDAVTNFATGLELVTKSHPTDFNPFASQALAKIREQVAGRSDLPVSDVKAALCRPPYGLTESMVMLYVFALIKSGGFELALNPNAGVTLSNGRPLPGNCLTAHTLPLCEWDTRLDRALLGSRLVESLHKGWNEVLPYARVLDPGLKPAATPDEEQARNESLLKTLAQLQLEIPEVEESLVDLAGVLSGSLPPNLKEILARYRGLVTAASYQEFDAAVRESYVDKDAFAAAQAQYDKARTVRDRAFHVSQMADYLHKACAPDESIAFERTNLLNMLGFESMLQDPSLIGAREENFARWKTSYIHAYRKAHRAHYENMADLATKLETLRPKASALIRMNGILELGPPLAATAAVADDLQALDAALWVCPDTAEAAVAGKDALCPRCQWHPGTKLPAESLSRLTALVSQGLADRFQRFKDAAIAAILTKAAAEKKKSGLDDLLDIIQLADADRLARVLNDDLVAFLRQILYDENLVDEQLSLAPILQQIGPIDETRVEEAVSTLGRLLTNAIKDAKAKHGPSKRVRIFLTLDTPLAGLPATGLGPKVGDAL